MPKFIVDGGYYNLFAARDFQQTVMAKVVTFDGVKNPDIITFCPLTIISKNERSCDGSPDPTSEQIAFW